MDKFLQAVTLYASLMGVDTPKVVDVSNLPGLRAAQATFDGYGWYIERDTNSPTYRMWDKELLALHELCHIRYHDFGHKYHKQCMTEYRHRRMQQK